MLEKVEVVRVIRRGMIVGMKMMMMLTLIETLVFVWVYGLSLRAVVRVGKVEKWEGNAIG